MRGTLVKYSALFLNLRKFSSSSKRAGLNEFFDHKDHINVTKITVGKPWGVEELRIKSNVDLHKLWYVILKERNMLLTMDHEYKRNLENLPAGHRLEKVEESLENILHVVYERDTAVNKLERGYDKECFSYKDKNILGIEEEMTATEHFEPKHLHIEEYEDMTGEWQEKYIKLLRENDEKLKKWEKRKLAKKNAVHDDIFKTKEQENA